MQDVHKVGEWRGLSVAYSTFTCGNINTQMLKNLKGCQFDHDLFFFYKHLKDTLV